MGKYQTRPVVVEAVQFTSPQDASALGIKKWHENQPHPINGSFGRLGTAEIWIGDWVVTRKDRGVLVYRPGEFEALYEEVPA